MSPIIIGIIGFCIFFILLILGLPVAFTLALTGFGGLVYMLGWGPAMSKIALVPFSVAGNYELGSLAFFVLMGSVVAESRLGGSLYDLAAKWLGFLRGGLAIATVGACAGFSAISSNSIAGHATMGPVALPEMEKHGYARSLATGCIAAGGTIGILIPPSGILILYGVLTETSIGKLFIGGVLPGILVAVFYMIAIYILCLFKPELGPKGPKVSIKEKIFEFKHTVDVLVLVALVLGGLMIGWFTPTEAGAVGAFGAIAIAGVRGRLGWKTLRKALLDTMKIVGMVYFIMIGANLFMPFLTLTTIPVTLAEWVSGLPLSPTMIMLVVILVYVVMGMFMDTMAMILITIPVFFPLALSLGYDPIWFGILVVRVMEIGMITPPVGMAIWVLAGITNTPVPTVTKGILPFIAADVVNVVVLLFVPSVVLFLPGIL